METLKGFKGYEDGRVVAKFSRIVNPKDFSKELAGYICWEYIEQQKSMKYFCINPVGEIITPYVATREEAIKDSAEHILHTIRKEMQESEGEKTNSNSERANGIGKIRENKQHNQDKGINI